MWLPGRKPALAPRSAACAWPRCWSMWATWCNAASCWRALPPRACRPRWRRPVPLLHGGRAPAPPEASCQCRPRAHLIKPAALSAQQVNQYLTAEQTAKARVESVKAGLGRPAAAPATHRGAGARQRRHLGAPGHGGRRGGRRHRAVPADPPGPAGVARRGRAPPNWRACSPGTAVTVLARQRRPADRPGAHGGTHRGPANPLRPGLCRSAKPRPRRQQFQGRHVCARRVRAGQLTGTDCAASRLWSCATASVMCSGSDPDQRVSQLKVQTGRRVGERVELLDGVGRRSAAGGQRRRLPERWRSGQGGAPVPATRMPASAARQDLTPPLQNKERA